MGRRPDMKQIGLRLPMPIYEATKLCAASVGNSMNSFIVQAVAQRVKNWRDPITGKRLVQAMHKTGEIKGLSDRHEIRLDGYVCTHGSHNGIPASECKYEKIHEKHWMNLETGALYSEDLETLRDDGDI